MEWTRSYKILALSFLLDEFGCWCLYKKSLRYVIYKNLRGFSELRKGFLTSEGVIHPNSFLGDSPGDVAKDLITSIQVNMRSSLDAIMVKLQSHPYQFPRSFPSSLSDLCVYCTSQL
ncbi:hypothetical protein ACET3Z_031091 [Daucus carota]